MYIYISTYVSSVRWKWEILCILGQCATITLWCHHHARPSAHLSMQLLASDCPPGIISLVMLTIAYIQAMALHRFNDHSVISLYRIMVMATSVVSEMKMGNIVPRAGLKCHISGIPGQCATIRPCRLPWWHHHTNANMSMQLWGQCTLPHTYQTHLIKLCRWYCLTPTISTMQIPCVIFHEM